MTDDPKPRKRQQALSLWDHGERDRDVIAATVGVEKVTVSTWLSRSGRLRGMKPAPQAVKLYSIVAPTHIATIAETRYCCRPGTLIRRLLEIIDRDDMYDAIFDDDKPTPDPKLS